MQFCFTFFVIVSIFLNFIFSAIPSNDFNLLKEKISIASTEEKAITYLQAVDKKALSKEQLTKLHQILLRKDFHVVIVDHLFSSHGQEFSELIYLSLFHLNEHEQILDFAFKGINNKTQHVSSHLKSIEKLISKGKFYLFTNQSSYFLTNLSDKDNHLLKFYLNFFQGAVRIAYSHLNKANDYIDEKTILSTHLRNEGSNILSEFYRLAHYREFLLATKLSNLFDFSNPALISNALSYLDVLPFQEDDPPSSKEIIKRAFYSNDYLAVYQSITNDEKHYHLRKSLFFAISLLELKKYSLYEEFFLFKKNDFYKLLFSVYRGDEKAFKNYFLSKKLFLEEELEIKNLLQYENHLPLIIEIVKLKYSHSAKLETKLENEAFKKSTPAILLDYAIISLMESCLNALDYQKLEKVYKNRYLEITTSPYQERALYTYGKSLERKNPPKAKSIYQKLLFKNPSTFYKFPIKVFFMEL